MITKRKEAKRKKLCPESNSGPSTHRAKDLPLGLDCEQSIFFFAIALDEIRTRRTSA